MPRQLRQNSGQFGANKCAKFPADLSLEIPNTRAYILVHRNELQEKAINEQVAQYSSGPEKVPALLNEHQVAEKLNLSVKTLRRWRWANQGIELFGDMEMISGLTVAGDHADGTEVMKDVLSGNGLPPDTTLGEGHILGDVFVQVMADHQHVQMRVPRGRL